MRKRIALGCLLVLILTPIGFATTVPTGVDKTNEISTTSFEMEWSHTFGGSERDVAFSLIQTADGGYALAGITESYGAGHDDMWLVKTDASGQAEWDKTFGGSESVSSDSAYSLIQTADGGYALAGTTGLYAAGHDDMWLVKTDVSGQAEWNKTFGGINAETAWSLIQTADGGYALAGETNSYGASIYDIDMWLVKTDASGQAEWNKTFDKSDWDSARSLIQTADGGYALAGETQLHGIGSNDMWLVKTDASGQAEWDKTFGGSEWDVANSLIQTADGGYVLAGTTDSYGAGNSDMWLVKTDASGQAEWDKTFGVENSMETARSLIQTVDGGYALVGKNQSTSADIDNVDMWLVKTDASGQAEWNKSFGGINGEIAFSLLQTVDGGYVLAGQTYSYGAGDYDMWLFKIKVSEETTTTTPTTTTTQTSPSWTPIIVLMSITAQLIFRERKKHR